VDLPGEASLEQLRKQAKDLLRGIRAGDAAARAEMAGRYPGGTAPFSLSEAQLAVARRYGFASWARLKQHVAVIAEYRRDPARADGADGADGETDLTDRFLALACLRYETDDGPDRWAQARDLLGENPGITRTSMHAAAAAADTGALASLLAANPAAATELGGPFRWEPLFYLAYARHDAHLAEHAVLTAARLLLAAGADPDAGYLWHGLPSPFTVLTGVFGEGELGPVQQPRHPHSLALARVLLQAGADPNDGQALYNRMFEPDNDHLELLLESGLGTGDGGPWRARLGDAIDSPAQLVRGQLRRAITHGMLARVQLLAGHGADIVSPFGDGVTPVARALTTGNEDIAAYLIAQGAPPAALDAAGEFIAAALAADRDRADAALAGEIREARPGLIVWAAAHGKPGAVELLAALGFDVNAMGRSDAPADNPRETALHVAAMEGNADLARSLLALGAGPGIRDARFDSTPLGWARHFGQQDLVDLLEPITEP
jgi:ankyrin repeat protein